jgi:hypothetical protein
MAGFELASNFPSMTYAVLSKIRTASKKTDKVFVIVTVDVEERRLLVFLPSATSVSSDIHLPTRFQNIATNVFSPLSPSEETFFEIQCG